MWRKIHKVSIHEKNKPPYVPIYVTTNVPIYTSDGRCRRWDIASLSHYIIDGPYLSPLTHSMQMMQHRTYISCVKNRNRCSVILCPINPASICGVPVFLRNARELGINCLSNDIETHRPIFIVHSYFKIVLSNILRR